MIKEYYDYDGGDDHHSIDYDPIMDKFYEDYPGYDPETPEPDDDYLQASFERMEDPILEEKRFKKMLREHIINYLNKVLNK